MNFQIDYSTYLQMLRCLAEKIKKEYNPQVIACIPRGGLSTAHILSLELGIPVIMYGTGFNKCMDKRVLIVDDSVGSGSTFEQVSGDSIYGDWKFAVFYVDGDYQGNVDYYCMKTHLWVVLPYEHKEKIIPGDRGSLFRLGTDPYQESNDGC